MRHSFALLLALLMPLSAGAQPNGSNSPSKIAIVSLIGDVMTVDTYRQRTGTAIDKNHKSTIALPKPVFDNAVLAAAEDAVFHQLAQDSTVATLAVPARGSGFDPARLLAGGAVSASNALVAALRTEGFTHLLAVTKHRGLARLELADGAVGSGHLEGIGFYVDHDFETTRVGTAESSVGFIAPYAYLRLLLIRLDTLEVQGDRTVTASVVRVAERSTSGLDPWDALSAEAKASMLLDLLQRHVTETVPLLFRRP